MISECFLVPDVFFYCVSCLCCHDLVGRVFVLIFSLFVTFLRAPEFSSLLLLPSFYLAATQVAPSIYAILTGFSPTFLHSVLMMHFAPVARCFRFAPQPLTPGSA